MPDWMPVDRLLRHHSAFYPSWNATYAEELRVRMGIPADRAARHLSKGQAGKLALLLALAHRPGLLILDEPTDGLDPVARRDFTELLMEYVADTHATVLVSSHIVHELERMADWIGVMDEGTMVAEMPLEAFRGHIKRLRVVSPAEVDSAALPFSVLSRVRRGREELWSVRGWEPEMAPALGGHAVQVREVVDLDLEECYVELLRNRTEARDAAA
jgi:ABC-2 type transport system ATP-binding protein